MRSHESGGEGGREGREEEVDSSVWEEQLQQELQDLELQVTVTTHHVRDTSDSTPPTRV